MVSRPLPAGIGPASQASHAGVPYHPCPPPPQVFGTYGVICAGAFFFVWFVVPETKGVARDGAHARADALLEALLGPEEEDGECASRDAGHSDKCPSPACHPATTPLGPEPEALTH